MGEEEKKTENKGEKCEMEEEEGGDDQVEEQNGEGEAGGV